MPRGRAAAKLGSEQKAGHDAEKKLSSEFSQGSGSTSNPTVEEGRQFGGLKKRK